LVVTDEVEGGGKVFGASISNSFDVVPGIYAW